MVRQETSRLSEGQWIVFDGGTVAPRLYSSLEGCTQLHESTGPGGWKASEYYEEMKDMLNDALGG